MSEDRLKISIDIDFDNYSNNLQNLNRALEQLSKATNLKLSFDINNDTTQQLNQINEVINKVNQATERLNGNKIGFNMDNILTQIKELKNYSGNLDEVKQKLKSLGEIRNIKSNLVDENGIKKLVASIEVAKGKIVDLQFAMNGKDLYKFDGIKSITDNTDKLVKKVEEFKEKWTQAINQINNKDMLSPGTIENLQKALDSLNIDSSKLNFDNVRKQINSVSKESDNLFNKQQSNIQKVISFIDRYTAKINNLYRNNNGGVDNAQILDLEKNLNSLIGTSDVSQLRNIELQYTKIVDQQKDYAKKIQDENQQLKEQEDLLKYISSQQERLKNIQSGYSTKIDTNSGLYGNLQNQYRNIFSLLDEYKAKKQSLTTEDKINITEQINNLRRLSNEYLNVNSFIRSQENELNNISNKYKSVLNPGEVERYINALKGFDPETNNLVGDMDKIIAKHQQLKNELNERVRTQSLTQNLGEKISSFSASGLNMNSGLRDIQDFLRQSVNAGANVSSVKNAFDGLGNKIKEVNYSVNEGHNIVSKYRAVMDETTGSIYNMSKGIQDLSSRHGTLGEQMLNSIRGILQWTVAGTALFGTLNQIKEAISSLNELNKSQTNIQMITGMNNQQIQGLTNQYANLATQLHSTNKEMMDGAETFLRAGANVEESKSMLKATTIGAALSGQTNQEVADQLIAISNGFRMNTKDAQGMMNVISKLTKADNDSATSFKEIATAMQGSSSTAQSVQVDFDHLLSYISTVSSATRKSASSIGESFNAMFARFENVKGGKKFDPNNEPLSNVERDLKRYANIDIRKDKNTFKSFEEVLDEVASKYNKLSGVGQAAVSKAMAGTYHLNDFQVLMQNYDKVNGMLKDIGNSAGYAENKYNNVWSKGTQARINDFKHSVEELYRSIGNSDEINKGISGANELLKTFTSLVNKVGLLPVLLSGIVPILTQFDKFKNFKPIDLTSSVGSVKVFGKSIGDAKSSFNSFTESYAKSLKAIQEFNGTMIQTPTLLERTKASMNALKSTTVATTIATGTLKAMEIALNAAITMGISIAIGALVQKIGDYINKVDSLKQKNQELLQSSQQSIQEHQSNVSMLSEMSAKYSDVYDRVQAYKDKGLTPLAEDTKALKDMNNDLAQKFPDLVSGYTDSGDAVLNLNGNLKDLIDTEKEKARWDAQKVINDSGFKEEDQMKTDLIKDRLKTLSGDSGGLGQTFAESSNKLQYLKDSSANPTQRAAMKKQLEKELEDTGDWYKKDIPYILKIDDAYQKLNPTLQTAIKNWAMQNKEFSKMSNGKDIQKQINAVSKLYANNDSLKLISEINRLNKQVKSGAVPVEKYTKDTDNLVKKIKQISGTSLSANQLKKAFNIDTSKISQDITKINSLNKSVKEFKNQFTTDVQQINKYNKILNDIKSTGKVSSDNKKLIEQDPELLP